MTRLLDRVLLASVALYAVALTVQTAVNVGLA